MSRFMLRSALASLNQLSPVCFILDTAPWPSAWLSPTGHQLTCLPDACTPEAPEHSNERLHAVTEHAPLMVVRDRAGCPSLPACGSWAYCCVAKP